MPKTRKARKMRKMEEIDLWTLKDFFVADVSSETEIWSYRKACTISDGDHDLGFFLALQQLCHGSLRDFCQATGSGVVDVVTGILNLSESDADAEEVSAISEPNI